MTAFTMAGHTDIRGNYMAAKKPNSKSPRATQKATAHRSKKRAAASMSEPKVPKKQAVKITLAPMLSVRNGADAVEFYKAALGARELFKIADPDGAVVAQLALGESEFWLADESPEHLNFSPESLGGATTRMVLVVDDPDSVFEKAVAAGASVVWPVADQPYGWRVGRVVDPFVHHWEIGKSLA
jgi:PhnB protein